MMYFNTDIGFNICTLIWESGCPTENSFYIYLILGRGIAVGMFIVLFISFIILDCSFFMKFKHLRGTGARFSLPLKERGVDTGKMGIVSICLAGIRRLKYEFYQVYALVSPIFSIWLFEIGNNAYHFISEYTKSFCSGVRGILSCVAAQWNWELFWVGVIGEVGYSIVTSGIPFNSGEIIYLVSGWYASYNKIVFDIQTRLVGRFGRGFKDLSLTGKDVVFIDPSVVFLTSKDVIHSFSCPSWGFKLDCVPGRVSSCGLEVSPSLNNFNVECAEFCGVGHPFMGLKVGVASEIEASLLYEVGEVVTGLFLLGLKDPKYYEVLKRKNPRFRKKSFNFRHYLRKGRVQHLFGRYVLGFHDRGVMNSTIFDKDSVEGFFYCGGGKSLEKVISKISFLQRKYRFFIYRFNRKNWYLAGVDQGRKEWIKPNSWFKLRRVGGFVKSLREYSYITPRYLEDKLGWMEAQDKKLYTTFSKYQNSKGRSNFIQMCYSVEKSMDKDLFSDIDWFDCYGYPTEERLRDMIQERRRRGSKGIETKTGGFMSKAGDFSGRIKKIDIDRCVGEFLEEGDKDNKGKE